MHEHTGRPAESMWLQLAKRFGVYVAIFVTGAVLAFVYSYVPLHNAKNWKIDYLTERLEAKDQQLVQAETRLSAMEADASGRPDAKTFKVLQDELAAADRKVKDLERKLDRSDSRVAELERARSHWKKKFEAAESMAAAAPPPAPVAAPAPSDGSNETHDGGAEISDFEVEADLGGREDS